MARRKVTRREGSPTGLAVIMYIPVLVLICMVWIQDCHTLRQEKRTDVIAVE